MSDPIAAEAEGVLKALGMWKLPVDPFAVAKEEGIELAPGNYGHGFDARIEYLPMFKRFVVYYREPGPGRTMGRVRFSLAHELGHFYLPDHREELREGRMHNSESDFRSKHPREAQADEFAASLLMPQELFIAQVRRFRQHVCTLPEICKLAEEYFHTSVTSTARRYCQCDIEACSIVVSREGDVLWAMHSEDMRRLNMKYIQFGQAVPRMSKTAALWDRIGDSPEDLSAVEGAVESDVWFERPYYRKELWEEAMPLGYTGLALTYLTLEDPVEDSE